MPNWCSNTITISGNLENMKNFYKQVGYTKGPLKSFIENSNLTLRSWLPMPEIFQQWDTTNPKRSKTNDETDEEYQRYCEAYDRAAEVQMNIYGVIGWYDYNCVTLGCKWDCDLHLTDCYTDNKNITITYTCDSPWSPPESWFYTMVVNNPNITFEMNSSEPGFNISLYIMGEDGEIVNKLD